MRFRPWLLLVATPVAVALTVGQSSAAAQNGSGSSSQTRRSSAAAYEPFDQLGMIRDMQFKLAEKRDAPKSWVELGGSFPIGTLEERGWDPGFLIRFNHEFVAQDPVGLVGSMGVLFNDDSRFNEAQIDANYASGFYAYQPIDSHHHMVLPFAVMAQISPGRQRGVAPVLGIGPSVVWTQEKLVRREWVEIFLDTEGDANGVFVVPIPQPGTPTPVAIQSLNKTHFHLGWQAIAGLRARVGEGERPLQMRLIGSANVWYEHDRPITLVGGALSFGR